MIVFCWIEVFIRLYGRNNRFVKNFFGCKVGFDRISGLFLDVVEVEDDGAILGADVVALTVGGSRVVSEEEVLYEVSVGEDLGVKAHEDDFGVAGGTGADSFVGRMGDMTSGVARNDFLYASEHFHQGFGAPEAATSHEGTI
jgi:hypothetical protein